MEVLEKTESGVAINKARKFIMDVEAAIKDDDNSFAGNDERYPLIHSFSDGIYVRHLTIPKNDLVVGKIHKYSHPNFLLEGMLEVFSETRGWETLKAPLGFIGAAGTKRIGMIYETVKWVTVHANPTNTQDLYELEEMIFAKSFAEYEEFIANGNLNKKSPCQEV